jgi:hypothetical protein
MKACNGSRGIAPLIFNVMRENGKLHAPAGFIAGKNPGTHSIGGWVGSTASVGGFGKEKISRPCLDPIQK